ncbi:MAG: DUF1549 domain-containing protein [Planctomycetes bacterium]|nr:DUF1549 domain-containing protein [Planctomycetota bacterium]
MGTPSPFRSLLPVALAAFAAVASAQTGAVNPQRPKRTVEDDVPAARIESEVARLDALLEHALRRRQVEPNPIVDDPTFARRAYLEIVGRIPTLAETESFLADQGADKRARLTDRLLDSPGHTSHVANWWFDILRVKSRNGQISGEPFAHFVREAVQQNTPYDQFVREMITASGSSQAPGNGATGFLMRDFNMPHDSMANTLRIFLGTRLECAQCHNHPHDIWTQRDFYGMAAFFGGIRYRDDGRLMQLRGAREKLQGASDRTRLLARQLARTLTYGISGDGTGVERLPADYKYDDARPQSPVVASTIFGANVKLKRASGSERRKGRARARELGLAYEGGVDSRAAFADWMTDKKNPMFTKVIVNRMWARIFGRGLFEPIDDWKKDSDAVYPDVLEHLEKLLVRLNYDLRQFERVLVRSQLFQRECPNVDPPADEPYVFAGPIVRRMTAEQMWDSLLTLVYADVDERLRPMDARAAPVYESFTKLENASVDDIIAMAEQRIGPRQMMRATMDEQAAETKRAMVNDAELRRRARPLLRELAEARRDGDQDRVAEIADQLEAMGMPLGRRARKGAERGMVRASDLEQPADPDHLLRQFGQSDRETIEGSNADATVPQVLTLLNGFLDQNVLRGASALSSDLLTAPDGKRRVEIAFLTTLNRPPTPDETRSWRRTIAIDGDDAIKDLVWVLCNSNEFRFVR